MIWKTWREASRNRAVPLVGPALDARHLLFRPDAGEAGAELHLALLGRGQVGSDLGKGAERTVDLVDVARREHAQECAPPCLCLALCAAQLLEADGDLGKLIVERTRRGVELFDALGHQESHAGQGRRVHGGGRFHFTHQLHHVTAESHPARSSQMAVTGLLHDEPQLAPSV
jgi:hypothetical protein